MYDLMGNEAQSVFYYSVFGMHVCSQLDFPEFVDAPVGEWASEPSRQVTLELASVPDQLPDPKAVFDWIQARQSDALFNVANRGKIYVCDGRRILIEPNGEEKLDELRPYLITCGFATLAFLRGWIPLHVGAVRSPKGVVLFCGASGAGKSTTAMAVAKFNKWELLADDMVVLEPSQPAKIHLGTKRVKLWTHAAQALDIDVAGLTQDYFRPFKYHANIEPAASFMQSEVVGVISLNWGDGTNYTPRSQAFAFQEMLKSIYPPYFGELYLSPSVKNAVLGRIFPVPISGVMTRQTDQPIRPSLLETANLVESLVRQL